jgi:predicted transcriptional regulator
MTASGRRQRVAIERFNLDGRGLTRVLGELEARIMEAVWRLGAPTGKELHAALGAAPHYKTVLTVANRLVEKGLLAREAPAGDRAYRYRATESRAAFLDRVATNVARGLVGDFGPGALAPFVRAADAIDPAYLDELERLVRERKGRR